jgi:hypothetical protein
MPLDYVFRRNLLPNKSKHSFTSSHHLPLPPVDPRPKLGKLPAMTTAKPAPHGCTLRWATL